MNKYSIARLDTVGRRIYREQSIQEMLRIIRASNRQAEEIMRTIQRKQQ